MAAILVYRASLLRRFCSKAGVGIGKVAAAPTAAEVRLTSLVVIVISVRLEPLESCAVYFQERGGRHQEGGNAGIVEEAGDKTAKSDVLVRFVATWVRGLSREIGWVFG